MASPLADPTPSHTHAAGHPQDAATGQPSTSYGANNADSDHTATSDDAKRPGGVHPGQFSHTHPKAAGRFGADGDAGPAGAAQQCTQYSTTRRADNGRETAQSMGSGHAQPASATSRPLEAGQGTQLRPSSEPYAARRRERQTRRLPSQDRSTSHSIDAVADPEATAETADPAAAPTQDPLVQIPKPAHAVTKRLSSAADPNSARCQYRTYT